MRKHWLFFEDADAGQRSAVIHTIIESCRRQDIDPHAYLRDVLTRITKKKLKCRRPYTAKVGEK